MSRSGTLACGLLAIFVVASIGEIGGGHGSSAAATNNVQTIGPVTFVCDGDKTIRATFNNNSAGASTVSLRLSDGRRMTLPQTVSGSGVRYANADETFVFWTKGNTAFVEEGKVNVPSPRVTYQGCMEPAPDARFRGRKPNG